MAVMIATVSAFIAAHFVEVVIWSVAYRMVDAVPPGHNTLAFALGNHTTLGYGDALPVKDWQLLGPITAMNGVLLFGWSVAVIFTIFRRAMAVSPTTS